MVSRLHTGNSPEVVQLQRFQQRWCLVRRGAPLRAARPPSAADREAMGASLLWMLTFCFGVGASCSDEPIISVSQPSKVLISCPSISTNSSEISYLLLFNGSSVFQIHLNKKYDSAEILFSTQIGITADKSGEFVCRKEKNYPPPFTQVCSTTTVKVSAEQSMPTVNATAPSANQSCPDRPPLIPEVAMWTGGGVLLFYSFTITCITVVIWRQNQKLKRDEDTKIYSNVRPKAIKKPNKA